MRGFQSYRRFCSWLERTLDNGMAGTTIRNVALDDADGVSLLVTELGYPTDREEMAERLVRLLSDPSYCAFVAERAGSLIGLAGGRIGRYFEQNGSYAHLVVMVVAASAQRTGVGTALLDAVEHWAAENGAREIIVNSGNHRDEAHRFYERRGFRATGLRFQKSLSGAFHRLRSTPGGAIMRPSPLDPSSSQRRAAAAREVVSGSSTERSDAGPHASVTLAGARNRCHRKPSRLNRRRQAKTQGGGM